MLRQVLRFGLCLLVFPSVLFAQGAKPSMNLNVNVDTSIAVIRHLVDTMQGYLSSEGPGWKPTPYWSATEQVSVDVYDPASLIKGYRYPSTILQVTPDVPEDSVYVIKVLFTLVDSIKLRFQPIALQRFYAVRQDSSWVLTSALRRLTDDWRTSVVGRIIYNYGPEYQFSIARAERAAALVDSLANVLSVPPPDTIHYHLAKSSDEMSRVLGFDWLLLPSGPNSGRGGWAGANQIFSGDPRQGENYRHELAHIIARPLRAPRGRQLFIEEGFATWIGGDSGGKSDEGLSQLREFARTHPAYSWQQLKGHSVPFSISYLSGALLFEAVYREAGWPGVRRLLQAGRTDEAIFAALPGSLRLTPESFETWWRSAVERATSRPASPL